MKLTRYYKRLANPHGFWGRRAMNVMCGKGHQELPEWVFPMLDIAPGARTLDVGCGGGENIARLLELCPNGFVTGLDHSELALDVAYSNNYRAMNTGRCYLLNQRVEELVLARDVFDMATAFETVYYWPMEAGLARIERVLKPGGILVIANERDGLAPGDRELEKAVPFMRVFTIDELAAHLLAAGFTIVKAHHDEARHFICLIARKGDQQ